MDSKIEYPRQTNTIGWRGILFALSVFLLSISSLSAGVLVAPTSVILSETKRTGRLTVQNPTDKPKEVTIRFCFGMPLSDSLGNVKISLQDSAITDPRSAVDWIKAFPRKMVLAPNSSQVVRFVARPPKDLPDGEYWARVVVRSQEGETSIPAASDNEKITTKLNMIMQTAIALKYRTGNLISKLEVVDTETMLIDSTVRIMIDLVNRGNVSYIGLLQCRLVDAKGNMISKGQVDLAVYRDLKRRMELPVAGENLQKPYKVEISIATEGRTDIAAEDLIAGNSIEYSAVVE
jgi:P pilus assembly chaperone PapD